MGGGGGGHCTRPLLPNGTGHKTARTYDNLGNFRSGAEEIRLVQCLKKMSKRRKTAHTYDNWGNFRSGAEEVRFGHCLKTRCQHVENATDASMEFRLVHCLKKDVKM